MPQQQELTLTGAIDMHIHSSPDVQPRKLNDIELAHAARQAGLSAIMLKCHHTPTTARAALASASVPGLAVFGGIVLNRPAGGLNPAAVEAELALGAKEVWLPTVSSVNHIRIRQGDLRQAVPLLSETGQPLPELYDVCDLVAKAGAILGTGHSDPAECETVIAAAQARGVAKILVTHPESELSALPVAVQQRLARRGVFFERCYFATMSEQRLPPAVVADQIRAVGVESTVLASDLGQDYNPDPPEGFRHFLAALMAAGIMAGEIEIMIRRNPRQLLGL